MNYQGFSKALASDSLRKVFNSYILGINMAKQEEQKEVEEKYMILQLIAGQLQEMQKQLESLEAKSGEIVGLKNSLSRLSGTKINSKSYSSLGLGTFVESEIKNTGNVFLKDIELCNFKIDTLNKKIDAVDEKLSKKIDAVDEKLSKKIDAVAADLKAHRADSEAHHGGVYLVKES